MDASEVGCNKGTPRPEQIRDLVNGLFRGLADKVDLDSKTCLAASRLTLYFQLGWRSAEIWLERMEQ